MKQKRRTAVILVIYALITMLVVVLTTAFRRPGAHIELYVEDAPVDAWASVQWQDETGGWQNVETWQGPLEEDGDYKSWWVDPKDFGKGPFRWLLTDGDGGSILAVSEEFALPTDVNEVLITVISLKPPPVIIETPWWKFWETVGFITTD